MIRTTNLDGVLIITPKVFSDSRGSFSETYNRDTLAGLRIDTDFVQDNQSYSADVGTVRGLHFQAPPHAQAKLVRVLMGEIWDVAVDIRRDSHTFGKWTGMILSAQNRRQLLIPAGFLHGFVTRAPGTIVAYKCSATYAPDCEGSVRFDDPDLGIDWGIPAGRAVLSDKDASAPAFSSLSTPFQMNTRKNTASDPETAG